VIGSSWFADLVKYVDSVWRFVPLTPPVGINVGGISLNYDSDPHLFSIYNDDFLYGFLPGTYRLVMPLVELSKVFADFENDNFSVEHIWHGDVWVEFIIEESFNYH